MEQSFPTYTRILKDHMQQFKDKNVTIVGKLKGKMGTTLTVETGENAVVLVENCDIKLDAAQVFLEVRGIVKNGNTLIMNEINEIPEDEKEPFDLGNYNRAIKYSVEHFSSLFF